MIEKVVEIDQVHLIERLVEVARLEHFDRHCRAHKDFVRVVAARVSGPLMLKKIWVRDMVGVRVMGWGVLIFVMEENIFRPRRRQDHSYIVTSETPNPPATRDIKGSEISRSMPVS